jgi:hypothetical protein
MCHQDDVIPTDPKIIPMTRVEPKPSTNATRTAKNSLEATAPIPQSVISAKKPSRLLSQLVESNA